MFGWRPSTIAYSMAVGSALSGTGLRVTGIEYGLQYFNQDFSRGSLSTTVTLRDTSNQILENYYHVLGQTKDGWTNFDQTKTFANAYSLSSLGTVAMTFSGQDDRFWAGYYGPQIRNPYIRLTYGPDICVTDPLSSASCPGYIDAVNKLLPSASNGVSDSPATTAASTTDSGAALVTPVSTSAPSAASANSATTVSATSSQPRPGEMATTSNAARTGPSTNQILNIVRAEQTRVAAVETTVTQQAMATAQQQADASVTESLSVSAATVTQSTASTQSVSARTVSIYSLSVSTGTADSQNQPVSVTAMRATDSRASDRTAAVDDLSGNSQGLKFDSTNLLNNYLNSMPTLGDSVPEKGGPQVNARAGDNQAAGTVTINTMAQQPPGFDAYASAMPDVSFYAPREIYRNQRVVDNARVQRALTRGSDAVHQRMVGQQYP